VVDLPIARTSEFLNALLPDRVAAYFIV